MFGFFLCRRVDFCGELDLEISQSIGLAGGNLGATSLSTAPLAYDFFRFVSGPQGARVEDLKRLVELSAVDYRDIAEVLSGR